MTQHQISSPEELRAKYSHPNPKGLAMRCILPKMDHHHRAFISYSPFIVIASTNAAGRCDVSPRGDLPGFVTTIDENTLLIPDRPGNNKILTLTNVVQNSSVAILFVIPGRDDSLRITGDAEIIADPDTLAKMSVNGGTPKSALRVHVENAWFHCGKAMIRSKLWSSDAQVDASKLPTLGHMLSEQITEVKAQEANDILQRGYQTMLWSDPRG